MAATVRQGLNTEATDELIGDLADWALEHRKEQIDPDTKVGGTWHGAITFPIFEGLVEHDETELADRVQEDLDSPEPTRKLIEEMHLAHGVPRAGQHREQAEAAAVIAAAVYDRLGLPQPTRDD